MRKENYSAVSEAKALRANREMQQAISAGDFDRMVDIRLWQCGYSYSDYGDSGSDTSDLVSSLVSAGTQLGSAIAVSELAPPVTLNGQVISTSAQSTALGTGVAVAPKSSMLVWIVLAIAAFFVYEKL